MRAYWLTRLKGTEGKRIVVWLAGCGQVFAGAVISLDAETVTIVDKDFGDFAVALGEIAAVRFCKDEDAGG